MTKLKAFLARHPNFRSAVRAFCYTFGANFSVALLAYVNSVVEWAGDNTLSFPAFTPLGRAAVGAATSAVAGAFAYLWNRSPHTATATYTEPPKG